MACHKNEYPSVSAFDSQHVTRTPVAELELEGDFAEGEVAS